MMLLVNNINVELTTEECREALGCFKITMPCPEKTKPPKLLAELARTLGKSVLRTDKVANPKGLVGLLVAANEFFPTEAELIGFLIFMEFDVHGGPEN